MYIFQEKSGDLSREKCLFFVIKKMPRFYERKSHEKELILTLCRKKVVTIVEKFMSFQEKVERLKQFRLKKKNTETFSIKKNKNLIV